MINHKEHFHGSDLEKIEQIYGIQKENIINFGANVNPLGISSGLKDCLAGELEVITSYPDREYVLLRQTIATYCQTKTEYIMVGNGTTELISLFIQCRHPRHALLVVPTYSEYERELTLSGAHCSHFLLKATNNFTINLSALDMALSENIDLLILCNPNNPTSGALNQKELAEILAICKRRNIFVIVDETYAEFAPVDTAITAIPLVEQYDNFVILRGISKFFASPGLRLGYAITGSTSFLTYVTEHKNPWSINSLAELAGRFIFSDTAYIETVKTLIDTERKRICATLSTIEGIRFFPPFANFVLVKIEKDGKNAEGLFETAIRQNMMIRNCLDFSGLNNTYFRFCFMKPDDNDKLLSCIKNYMVGFVT